MRKDGTDQIDESHSDTRASNINNEYELREPGASPDLSEHEPRKPRSKIRLCVVMAGLNVSTVPRFDRKTLCFNNCLLNQDLFVIC